MFPILRLPHIALKEVLSKMSPFELINFSLINPTTKLITKTCTRFRQNRFKIRFEIDKNPRFSIVNSKMCYDYQWTDDKTKCETFEVGPHGEQIINKCSEDEVNNCKQWAEYVLDVLNSDIRFFRLCTDDCSEQAEAFIDWVKSKSIEICVVREGNEEQDNDEIVKYLLENLETTECLGIMLKLSDQFRSALPKVSDEILIEPAKWITLQHLLNMDCLQISLMCTNLTNQDLSTFLISWMCSESNPRLKLFCTTVSTENVLDEILEDVPHEQIGLHISRTFQVRECGIPVTGGKDILRIDGTTATLYTEQHPNYLFFVMIVH